MTVAMQCFKLRARVKCRGGGRSSAHLSNSGLFLLELTQSQDTSPRLVIKLLLEGVEQLHLLAKTEVHTHTHKVVFTID